MLLSVARITHVNRRAEMRRKTLTVVQIMQGRIGADRGKWEDESKHKVCTVVQKCGAKRVPSCRNATPETEKRYRSSENTSKIRTLVKKRVP